AGSADYVAGRAPASPSRPSRPAPSKLRRAGGPPSDPMIGMRVRHSKYGLGTITGVEGEGEDRKLMVSFQDYGPKKLVERYANLQPA
ncbi:MAG: hypothetical protein WAL86_13790, partial [Candidatus Acidiferrales bacterium]